MRLLKAVKCAAYLFAFAGSTAVQSNEFIAACIEDQLFNIPLHPGLSISETDWNYVPPYELEEFLAEQSPNGELLRLNGFSYSTHGRARFGPPPLELILGRPIPYRVSQIVIRKEPDVPYSSICKKPSSSILTIHKEDSEEEREVDLTYFGDPVTLNCSSGLPAYSTDPETLSCTLYAKPDNENSIRVGFRTSRDLDGPWPQAQHNPESLQEPIDLIQQAVETLKADAKSSSLCS